MTASVMLLGGSQADTELVEQEMAKRIKPQPLLVPLRNVILEYELRSYPSRSVSVPTSAGRSADPR